MLTPDIFHYLAHTKPGINGEIQLTDALRFEVKEKELLAFEFDGKRYDIGRKMDWFIAFIDYIMLNPEYKMEIRRHMQKWVR